MRGRENPNDMHPVAAEGKTGNSRHGQKHRLPALPRCMTR